MQACNCAVLSCTPRTVYLSRRAVMRIQMRSLFVFYMKAADKPNIPVKRWKECVELTISSLGKKKDHCKLSCCLYVRFEPVRPLKYDHSQETT